MKYTCSNCGTSVDGHDVVPSKIGECPVCGCNTLVGQVEKEEEILSS